MLNEHTKKVCRAYFEENKTVKLTVAKESFLCNKAYMSIEDLNMYLERATEHSIIAKFQP